MDLQTPNHDDMLAKVSGVMGEMRALSRRVTGGYDAPAGPQSLAQYTSVA